MSRPNRISTWSAPLLAVGLLGASCGNESSADDTARLGQRAVAHQADLPDGETTDADGWSTVTVSYDELVPSVFGQPVEAPSFDPDEAREFGIIIADGTDGGFALDIDWIDVCR